MPTTTDILDIPAVRALAHRMTVERYHRLGKQGLIDEKTELIRGVVIDKISKSPLHGWLLQMLGKWLHAAVCEGWRVRFDQPLTLKDSEPEPDVAVVTGSDDDYRARHPKTAALVIEIAVTSDKLDREKAAIYAEAGVEEYWIVFAERQYVEVYRTPEEGQYKEVIILKPAEVLRPLAFSSLELPVATLFPDNA